MPSCTFLPSNLEKWSQVVEGVTIAMLLPGSQGESISLTWKPSENKVEKIKQNKCATLATRLEQSGGINYGKYIFIPHTSCWDLQSSLFWDSLPLLCKSWIFQGFFFCPIHTVVTFNCHACNLHNKFWSCSTVKNYNFLKF